MSIDPLFDNRPCAQRLFWESDQQKYPMGVCLEFPDQRWPRFAYPSLSLENSLYHSFAVDAFVSKLEPDPQFQEFNEIRVSASLSHQLNCLI